MNRLEGARNCHIVRDMEVERPEAVGLYCSKTCDRRGVTTNRKKHESCMNRRCRLKGKREAGEKKGSSHEIQERTGKEYLRREGEEVRDGDRLEVEK